MPRFLLAPDSFKGSLSASQAAAAMAAGIRSVCAAAEIDQCPIADGGEGTVDAMVHATSGELRHCRASDPLGRLIDANWGWLGQQEVPTAVVEVAAATGLTLLRQDERDPTRTSSFGTGQVLLAAVAAGARRILLGLGGSASNDGGCGAAMALGVRFFTADQRPLETFTGADLLRVHRIDASQHQLEGIELVICRDVDNPLTGADGAAAVYGPQKGATATQVQRLDQGLAHLGELWQQQLGIDVRHQVGAGAAGGMGGGIVAMLGATSQSGIDTVLQAVRFADRVRHANHCFTGEGQFDSQSLTGKACLGVAQAAHRAGVPTTAIVGRLRLDDPEVLRRLDCSAVELAPGLPVEASMQQAEQLLRQRSAAVLRTILA